MSQAVEMNSFSGDSKKNVSLAPSTAPSVAPTVDLGGQIDGEREPRNKMEEIKAKLMPYVQRYRHVFGMIRPWAEFIKFSKPSNRDEVSKRLYANLFYFQANYALIACLMTALSILSSPSCLVLMLSMSGVWLWFVGKNEDENWKPTIAGMELSKTQRTLLLMTVTVLLFLIFASSLIMSALGFSIVLVGGHAALNSGVGWQQMADAQNAAFGGENAALDQI